MSDTPKTDALVGDFPFPWSYHMEMLVRHAEQLERELNAAPQVSTASPSAGEGREVGPLPAAAAPNDPTNWNTDPDTGSLAFASPEDAKKAEALFKRVQDAAYVAGVDAAAYALRQAWANYRDENGTRGSELAALLEGAIVAVKAAR